MLRLDSGYREPSVPERWEEEQRISEERARDHRAARCVFGDE
ncbi:hypothetical protein [Natronococcus sp. A-GB7]|nr:hypothetical protein [Natronococcus sp. A-GB7]MDG5819503.1 hypothetical protein [Natronococcus sp. A-GB7]